MKKAIIAILVLVVLGAGASFADERVKGHYRDTDGDGYKETYINPYNRTSPDGTRDNNYSTKGNTNPYNGKSGSEPNDFNSRNSSRDGQYKSIYGK